MATACGGSTLQTSPTSAAGEKPLSLQQQMLTVGALADQYNIEPGRVELGKFTLNAGVFEGLVRLDENLQVAPVLAQSWDFTDASNTFRFHLRPGVRFHDGSEFGAEDVKYTFDLIVKGDPANSEGLGPDSVRVVDPLTVDITPVKKNLRLVEDIAHPLWAINRRGRDPLKPIGLGRSASSST
ncbi:MAG: ABC transporter substrate-binding protein [Acidimicrobiales bacterium]